MRLRFLVLTAAALTLVSLLGSPALAEDGSGTPPTCQTSSCTDSGNWPK
ncbi:hypothetical protein [Nocardiopsis lambiniae]|uniref:Uncharacterized protein n=1 Tax=Nocardiopsis lambiniae TaxID=3075539 RepID=A0ABU2M5Z2_9ACTN|nr:hypothetical protein [Nocardiopsis sp. DSM 44743]MDT0328079.1 hypothetical protein [Nocardiopsis sp. DSM 44743]